VPQLRLPVLIHIVQHIQISTGEKNHRQALYKFAFGWKESQMCYGQQSSTIVLTTNLVNTEDKKRLHTLKHNFTEIMDSLRMTAEVY
jgi:hypothetical protein